MGELKFKKGVEEIYTSDFWYDLTMGGYIKPEKYLEDDDAKKLNDAIKLVRQFEEELYERELLIEL